MFKSFKIAALLVALGAAQLTFARTHAGAELSLAIVTAISLKEARKKRDDAKTAWQTARKGNKPEEIATARTEMLRYVDALDAAEADGKTKDEDTVEIKSDETPAELTLKDVQDAIGAKMLETMQQELPRALKGHVTEEGIKALIQAEFKKLAGDSQTITKASINTIIEGAMKTQMETFRNDKKSLFEPGDANPGKSADNDNDSGSRIEYPISWTKGNLPLHGKQLLNVLMKRNMNEGIDKAVIEKGEKLGSAMLSNMCGYAKMLEQNRGTPGMKALTSTGAGTGDEFVPTDLSSQLQRRFFLASNLAAILAAREIDMPTDPYGLPLSTTRPSFFLETTENNAATKSTPGTGKPTLTTIRLVGETDYSYEIDEDSIIPILPMLQTLMAEGAADAWEHALINGDDTATHMDTDEELLTQSPAFGFKGFRKLALAITELKTDLTTGGVGTNANLLSVRAKMKKYGVDPKNLIWLVTPTSAITMQGVAEVVSVDKFGSRATIITGEIAAIQGIPIIASERMREDVSATGVNGASGNTLKTILCVNITRFLTGRRREFMIEVDKNIQSGTNIVVASLRKAFVPVEVPSATVTSVSIGYNFA